MKKFLYKRHTAITKLFFFSLLLVGLTLPFSIHFNSFAIIIALFFSCFYFFSGDHKKTRVNKYFFMFAGLYLMHFIGFVNSVHIKPVLFDIEQKLALLALPLVLMLGPSWQQKKQEYILISFVVATCLVCVLIFRGGFYWGYSESGELYKSLLIRHPYLGMYCVLCIFFCTHIVSEKKKWRTKVIYFTLIIFLIFFLFVLFAKMAIVVFFFLMITYFIGLLWYKKKYIIASIFIASLFALTSYFTFINSTGRHIGGKLFSLSEFKWSEYDAILVNSLNLRFISWTCAVETLQKDNNWLFGAGTGDFQDLLDSCYTKKLGTTFFTTKHYDPHNQYFTTWLSLGFFPSLFFILHFIILLYVHARNKNLIAFTFTFGIMLFCLTESIMENQKGIVFYAFFQSLFLFGEQPAMRKT